jgi:hypothetical protein
VTASQPNRPMISSVPGPKKARGCGAEAASEASRLSAASAVFCADSREMVSAASSAADTCAPNRRTGGSSSSRSQCPASTSIARGRPSTSMRTPRACGGPARRSASRTASACGPSRKPVASRARSLAYAVPSRQVRSKSAHRRPTMSRTHRPLCARASGGSRPGGTKVCPSRTWAPSG